MAFEKPANYRHNGITAIPKPRSRERFRKIAETTPTPRKRALRTRCLSPQKNEISRAGPLLAICRSQSIHYGSPDNPQRNIRHKEEQDVADFVENDSREVDHVTMFGR